MADSPDTRDIVSQREAHSDRIANPYRDRPQEQKNEQDDEGVAGRYDGEDVEIHHPAAPSDRAIDTRDEK